MRWRSSLGLRRAAPVARSRICRRRIINDREMKDVVLLVFANKNDLPNVMDVAEVTEKLGLARLRERCVGLGCLLRFLCRLCFVGSKFFLLSLRVFSVWHVQSSCAISGDGLLDGLTWLNQQVK